MFTTGAAARVISAVATPDEDECWSRWRSSDEADEPDEAEDEAAVAGNGESEEVSEKADRALAARSAASAPDGGADEDGPTRAAPVALEETSVTGSEGDAPPGNTSGDGAAVAMRPRDRSSTAAGEAVAEFLPPSSPEASVTADDDSREGAGAAFMKRGMTGAPRREPGADVCAGMKR
ncbi:MAG: hypothetical protein ABJA82_08260 [Myxococcales bacterium]